MNTVQDDKPDMVKCPHCDGAGEVEEAVHQYNGRYTRSQVFDVKCETCQGTGQIENDEYLAIKRANEKHRERLNHWLS